MRKTLRNFKVICELADVDAGSLKMAMAGEFIPWRMANATNQPSFIPPLESSLNIYQHIAIEDGIVLRISPY